MSPAHGAIRRPAPEWQPYREPLRTVILRTGTIALVAGAVAAALWGGFARWPMATLLALWPTFGGHWVEVWFLNWLRPRLPMARAPQLAARLSVWFIAGIGLAMAMRLTFIALMNFAPRRWPQWWIGGLAFIAIELTAHLPLQLRGRRSFYNGLG